MEIVGAAFLFLLGVYLTVGSLAAMVVQKGFSGSYGTKSDIGIFLVIFILGLVLIYIPVSMVELTIVSK
ncbi:hypothetical protein [Synechococcus phage BUCT-ZZ01]|nr:hypothetical protein [Synechococcus phage BUCT-ZZ01]